MDATGIRRAFGIGDGFSNVRPVILPELTTATVIGISVAIAGNILISLSLNIQKLAHKRLDADKSTSNTPNEAYSSPSSGHRRVDTMYEEDEDSDDTAATPRPNTNLTHSETQALVPFPHAGSSRYGSIDHHPDLKPSGRSLISRLLPRKAAVASADAIPTIPVEVVTEQEALRNVNGPPNGHKKDDKNPHETNNNDPSNSNESEYLKSKLWYDFSYSQNRRKR
ncbi:hypothetical protein PM082_005269 [Marasmius tenuissimus]|nr:hypothetical protein PM082_005269 [Marasmius tenuissimus]